MPGTINLTNIPKNEKGKFQWKNLENINVPFEYRSRGKTTKGDLTILKSLSTGKGTKLLVHYLDNEPHEVGASDFATGHIGTIIGINTKKFKCYVGQQIKDKKGDITITEVYRKPNIGKKGRY